METFVDGPYSNDLLIYGSCEKRRTPNGLQAQCAIVARKWQLAHVRNDDFGRERMGKKLQGASRVEALRSHVGQRLAGILQTLARPRTGQFRSEAARQIPKARLQAWFNGRNTCSEIHCRSIADPTYLSALEL